LKRENCLQEKQNRLHKLKNDEQNFPQDIQAAASPKVDFEKKKKRLLTLLSNALVACVFRSYLPIRHADIKKLDPKKEKTRHK
jgi:hypothetical protein